MAWGDNYKSQKDKSLRVVEGLEDKNIVALSVGDASAVFVSDENKVYFLHSDIDPETGAKFLFEPNEKITFVANNQYQFCILCENSQVYMFSCGDNFKEAKLLKELQGKKINHICASKNTIIFSSLYNNEHFEDKLYQMNEVNNNLVDLNYNFDVENRIVNVFSGGETHYVHLEDGTIVSFGDSGNGSLGRKTGDTFDIVETPQPVIASAALYYGAVMSLVPFNTSSLLYGFGYNSNGEMGLGANSGTKHTPVELQQKERKIVGIFTGYFHVNLLLEDDYGNRQVVGWGYNYDGQVKENESGKVYDPINSYDSISHFLTNYVRNRVWSPQSHQFYPHASQNKVLLFYLCLKRLKLKVPKYLVFEIIKLFV